MQENQLSLPLEKNNIVPLKPSTKPFWSYGSGPNGVLNIYKPNNDEPFTVLTALWLLEQAKLDLLKE